MLSSFDVPPDIYSSLPPNDFGGGLPLYDDSENDNLDGAEGLASLDAGRGPTFYDNLALDNDSLDGLAETLLQAIADDKLSRQGWENDFNLGLKYLGINIEEFVSEPFAKACSAFDSTLLTALLNFYCVARAELLPPTGPVSIQILGVPTDALEDQAMRVTTYMNNYLVNVEKGNYPDFERLLMYTGLCGAGFRKVYQDPILNRPVARFINPLDIIIDVDTTAILKSTRITEVQYLTRKEIMLKQENGYFVEFDLPEYAEDENENISAKKTIDQLEGIKKTGNFQKKSLFKCYEVHVELLPHEVEKGIDKDLDAIPRPYVITICECVRKIVCAYRSWKPEDTRYNPVEYYVNYYCMAGFGIYGLGFVHLAGSNSITMTNILRQSVNAGMLKMIPGGIITEKLRVDDNNNPIGPGEFRYINTEKAANDCFAPLPFGEPSQTLIQLRGELRTETQEMLATTASQIPDIGANAPVGTTMAMLEVSSKMQSTILRSLHVSLGRELQLMYNLFGEYLPDEPYPFSVPGKEMSVMRTDFNDSLRIVPVSDPNLLTSTHRLLRAEAELKLAQTSPELHDMREFYKRMYKAFGLDQEEIDKLMPEPPQPMALDALSENALMLGGKPVIVATFQDDDAHNLLHLDFASQMLQQGNIPAYMAATTHIQTHKGIKAWKDLQRSQAAPMYEEQRTANIMQGMPLEMADAEMQQALANMQFPPLDPEQLQQVIATPEVQNRVSMQDAEEAHQKAIAAQEAAAAQLDPNKIMLAQIEQQREAAHLKSEADKLKVEADSFKAQLSHESETNKTDSQLEIAMNKNDVDLAIAADKHAIERMRLEGKEEVVINEI